MNPELLRNLWLELAPKRVLLVVIVIGSVLLLGSLPGYLGRTANVPEVLFYAVAVFWGTRGAAQSVIEEVAGKTWDAQRLSAIRPWSMVWGKLLGSTALAWLGGLMCLAVIASRTLTDTGPQAALQDVFYFVCIGLLSQSVAFLAGLLAVQRRATHSRFDVFIYQSFGLLTALFVAQVWRLIVPDSRTGQVLSDMDGVRIDFMPWWGSQYKTAVFLLVSLVAFAAWTLLANYRVMRRELQMRNTPIVWFLFLAFVAVYAAGLDPWQPYVQGFAIETGLRAAQATIALSLVTYATAFVEPKDVVAYRWLVDRFTSGRIISVIGSLPAWVLAFMGTAIAAGLTIAFLPWHVSGSYGMPVLDQTTAVIIAGMGLLLRDCGIFVVFGLGQGGTKKADIAALAVLAVLYIFAPNILGYDTFALFYPVPSDPYWLNPLLTWGQALAVWVIILARRDMRLRQP